MERVKARSLGVVGALALLGAFGASAQQAPSTEHGWAGLRYQDYKNKVVVFHVDHGSPAETAGVPSGCIVETVGGLAGQPQRPVPNAGGLSLFLHTGKPGQTCTFGILVPRTGERKEYTVTLGVHDFNAQLKLALVDGAAALVARRAPSGAGWTRHVGEQSPEDVGSGITALAVRALAGLPPDLRKPHEAAIAQALATLLARQKPEGWIDDPAATGGETYETYATAETILALAARKDPNDQATIAALTSGLRGRQLGLPEGQGAFGGWFDELYWQYGGFPFEARPVDRTSVRVTVGGTAIAVEALSVAGAGASDPALVRARRYFERVQNWNAENDPLFADLRDGGFPETRFFSKAGFRDVGEERIARSYGSTTADGVRGLLACGAPKDDPRLKGAADWLRNHYDGRLGRNPGFEDERPPNDFGNGIHFYYLASISWALDALGEDPFLTHQGTRRWGEDLVDAVAGATQRADGAWRNPKSDMAEDNETIATSFALLALESAQKHLGEPPK
jgi:squalene-hopene/tetraprenyl-beta-curcumene cyclase